MRERDRLRMATAYHEAAHAVAACHYAYRCNYVNIKRSAKAKREGVASSSFPIEGDWAMLKFEVSMAGQIAELWIDPAAPASNWSGDTADMDRHFEAYATREGWSEDERPMWRQAMENNVRARVEALRPQIEIVARELLRKKRLTGDEVKALIAQAPERKAA